MRSLRATAVLMLLAASWAPAGAASRAEFEVIVNPASPAQSIDRKLLADIFLKKVTRWENDVVVQPIDREADASVRERFSSEVLQRSVGAVKNYWEQLIFSGRALPPPEVESDNEVVTYVLTHPGAVGYVSVGTTLRGVRVLTVR